MWQVGGENMVGGRSSHASIRSRVGGETIGVAEGDLVVESEYTTSTTERMQECKK